MQAARIIATIIWTVVMTTVWHARSASAVEYGFNGRAVDSKGVPLVGPVNITLRFFADILGDEQLGSSISFPDVALNDGNFQLILDLDQRQRYHIFGDGSRTVYVEIEAAGRFYPRQRFSPTPLARRGATNTRETPLIGSEPGRPIIGSNSPIKTVGSDWASQPGSMIWTTITTSSYNAAVGNAYFTSHESRVTINLPSICAVGDRINVVGVSPAGWALSSGISMLAATGAEVASPLLSIAPGQVAEILCVQANRQWQISFPAGPNAPIGQLPDYTGFTSEKFTGNLTAVSPYGRPVSFSCVACSGGINVNPSTGAVSWAPTFSQVGRHIMTFGVSDGIATGTFSAIFNIYFRHAVASSVSMVVPFGVTSLNVKAWGGGGGSAAGPSGFAGGGAGFAQGKISVKPGEILTLTVGHGGQGGYVSGSMHLGGVGGGKTAIQRGSSDIFVAAGGGGGGYFGIGGAGGGMSGLNGSGTFAGGGGTQVAGGAGGQAGPSGYAGAPGTLGNGGLGYRWGNGGGGYFGGGAGGSAFVTGDDGVLRECSGGGGGGASYAPGGSSTAGFGSMPGNSSDPDRGNAGLGGTGAGLNGNDGLMIITW